MLNILFYLVMFFWNKDKYFKKIGFYKDQKGILKRYLREKENWDFHLEKTKSFIIKALESKKGNKAVVFGSGWLLDVPIDELSKKFNEVWLVDIFHPKEILKKISNYSNVKTHIEDITGFSKSICEFSKKSNLYDLKSDNSIKYFLEEKNFDFFVSVNILNQLDILLVDYLSYNWAVSEEEILLFRKKIQAEHLKLMPQGKSCLITDYQEENYKKAQIIQTKQLIHVNLPEGNFNEKWDWIFDTNSTYNNFSKTILKAQAIDF